MGALLTPAQAAELLGLKVQTLAVWRCKQPERLPWIQVSDRAVRYSTDDLDAYVAQRRMGGRR
jgi:hypothetical protein